MRKNKNTISTSYKPHSALTLFAFILLTISLSCLLESSFYSCTDCATAHNTRERVLQYEKIDKDRFTGKCSISASALLLYMYHCDRQF